MILIILIIILFALIILRGQQEHSHLIRHCNINLGNVCREACNKNIPIEEQKRIVDIEQNDQRNIREDEGNQQNNQGANKNIKKLQKGDDLSDIDYLYDMRDGCYGDNALVNKMMHMGMKNKHAINNRARWNTSSFKPFIENELEDYSNLIWWEDNQDLEQYF